MLWETPKLDCTFIFVCGFLCDTEKYFSYDDKLVDGYEKETRKLLIMMISGYVICLVYFMLHVLNGFE